MQNDRNKIEDRTIEGFVSRRWAEAKDVVRQLDPEFVSGIEAAASLSNSGVWVPQIDSKKRLPKRWTNLLETCADIMWTADLMCCSAEQLGPGKIDNSDTPEAGRLATYHAVSWVHHRYAFKEKLERVVVLTCRVGLQEGRGRKIELQYLNRIRELMGKRREFGRTALTHGVGGGGPIQKGITEDELWEKGVALNLLPRSIFRSVYEANANSIERWHKARVEQTSGLLEKVGEMLAEFDEKRFSSSEAI